MSDRTYTIQVEAAEFGFVRFIVFERRVGEDWTGVADIFEGEKATASRDVNFVLRKLSESLCLEDLKLGSIHDNVDFGRKTSLRSKLLHLVKEL